MTTPRQRRVADIGNQYDFRESGAQVSRFGGVGLTMVGNASVSSGALQLDGSGDYAYSGLFGFGGDSTGDKAYEIWFSTSRGAQASGQWVGSKRANTPDEWQILLGLNTNEIIASVWDNVGGQAISSGVIAAAGTVYHVVLNARGLNGEDCDLYVNAELKASVTLRSDRKQWSLPVYFGTRSWDTGNGQFAGRIYEWRKYWRLLTPVEIQMLYKAGRF